MGSRDQLERRLPGKPGEQFRVAVERGAAAQEQKWRPVGKGHCREALPALQRCPPNGLPVLRHVVLIVTIAGRQIRDIAWIGGDLHRPFGNLVERSKITVAHGPAIFLVDLLTCREILRAETWHGTGPLIGEATQSIVVFEIGFRIAGDDESGRLRHGRKMSIEISSRHPDERAALYVRASFQHRHWNALPDELVRRHRTCWATAYDNYAAIVTHAYPRNLSTFACVASFGRGRHGAARQCCCRSRSPIVVNTRGVECRKIALSESTRGNFIIQFTLLKADRRRARSRQ